MGANPRTNTRKKFLQKHIPTEKARPGVIVSHYGVAVEVLFEDSQEKAMVRVKRNSGHVVGDRVRVRGENLKRLERLTEISRMNARGGIHLVGANLDILGIVISCEPLPPPGFVDRAIVAARAAALIPILVINKSDIRCTEEYQKTVLPSYQKSVQIFSVSALQGNGLLEMEQFFAQGHRGIFVGPTGVGKSSILNGLLPDLNLQTGEISESKKRGRHTTTVSSLHRLPLGGELIDSPGFNDFGLVDIDTQQLAGYFPGFEQANEHPCKFRDCKHRQEPECSVTNLLSDGVISKERYHTYLQLLEEVEAMESEPRYRERRHRRKKS